MKKHLQDWWLCWSCCSVINHGGSRQPFKQCAVKPCAVATLLNCSDLGLHFQDGMQSPVNKSTCERYAFICSLCSKDTTATDLYTQIIRTANRHLPAQTLHLHIRSCYLSGWFSIGWIKLDVSFLRLSAGSFQTLLRCFVRYALCVCAQTHVHAALDLIQGFQSGIS